MRHTYSEDPAHRYVKHLQNLLFVFQLLVRAEMEHVFEEMETHQKPFLSLYDTLKTIFDGAERFKVLL